MFKPQIHENQWKNQNQPLLWRLQDPLDRDYSSLEDKERGSRRFASDY